MLQFTPSKRVLADTLCACASTLILTLAMIYRNVNIKESIVYITFATRQLSCFYKGVLRQKPDRDLAANGVL